MAAWNVYGEPLRRKGPKPKPLEERFWPKVNKTATCWLWTGSTMKNGYGIISSGGHNGRHLLAHRASYEMAKGPIPTGLDIDHLCRVRNCVNPDHLEAVTRQENLRRGNVAEKAAQYKRDRTHCQRGHPFSGENLYIGPNGRRACKACWKMAHDRYEATDRAIEKRRERQRRRTR